MVEHRVIIVTLWVCVLSSIINVQLCHSKESRIAQYWCEFPLFLRSSAASEVGAANTALSHTTAQLMEPPDGGTSSQQALLRCIEKKTLTTLNFAMVTSEKPVLPTVSEKHQLAWWARTRARVFVCGSKISVSFISLSFIMMIANLNLNAAAAAAMVALRGDQFYY